MTSKIFDNATSCSSENSLVIVDEVYEKPLKHSGRGWFLLIIRKHKIRDNLWIQGKLNPHLIANLHMRSNSCWFQRPEMRQQKSDGGKKTGQERASILWRKTSPVLTLYRAENFKSACQRIIELYEFQGKGHSVGLHSKDENAPWKWD
ncbi:MAG: hypothetical protein Ct9H300mP28_23860 [Pseudomonadota bacterium]|nr:MAG: hypothetical protein Ct9H300mP28_23860 [Pseudomonadota bacterium]